MGALLRRAARVLLLVTVLGTLGSFVGVVGSAAATRPGDTSATPGVPTSTVTEADATHARYCVDNYAPNSTVTTFNQRTGTTGTIHTDATGHGCTTLPVQTACSTATNQTIVANGTDQKGNPASSQATYSAPPDPSQCTTPTPTPTGTSTGNPTPTPTPTSCDKTQISISVTVVPEGGHVSGVACGFTPGETVDGYVHSATVYVGTTTAGSNGDASLGFKLPPSIGPGEHTMILIGQRDGYEARASFTVTAVQTGGGGGTIPGSGNGHGGGSGNGTGGGGGGLAFTGADIAAMVLAGVVLVGLGLTTLTIRRRRTAPAA